MLRHPRRFPDPLSPPFSIIHRFRKVFKATSCIGTELLYVGSSWSSCLCSSMRRGSQEYVTYEFVSTSPACLVRQTWIVFVTGGKWPYSCCFVGCCLQGGSILVQLPSSYFTIHLVSVHVVHPYSSIDTITAWKKLCFILSVRSHFHMTDSLSKAVHAFASHVLMSVSVDETLLPR